MIIFFHFISFSFLFDLAPLEFYTDELGEIQREKEGSFSRKKITKNSLAADATK